MLLVVCSTAAGGVAGGLTTLGACSFTVSTPAIAHGAGAYAVGAGTTAAALEKGITIAIGAGASAKAGVLKFFQGGDNILVPKFSLALCIHKSSQTFIVFCKKKHTIDRKHNKFFSVPSTIVTEIM